MRKRHRKAALPGDTNATMSRPRTVWQLIADLYDDDVKIQMEAAETLGRLRDAAAVEPLISILEDGQRERHWDTYKPCSAAASALGAIGDPRAVEPLIAALRHSHWMVGEAAASALGEIGDPRAVDPLIDALRGSFPDVRAAAASALGAIGDARAMAPLVACLGPFAVSDEAARALERFGAAATEPLVDQLGDDDVRASWKRVEALARLGAPIIPQAVEVLVSELRLPPAQEGRWGREARWRGCEALASAIRRCIPAVVDAPDSERAEAAEALRAARRVLRGALWPWSRVPRDVKKALRDLLRAMKAAGIT